nr:uncharacterized protein K02A2.6-like [Lytechinus pictus]
MLNGVHSSHLGVDACVRCARDVLFWPGMQAEVTQCSTCNAFQPKQQKEPMLSYDIPSRPWSIVSQDLFTLHNLITVDHYSDYWEIDKITGDTRAAVIVACTKGHFARYGRPDKVITDNGPQFVAKEYAQFVADWEVEHITSSPLHAQSNGKAESAVKIAKTLLKKAAKQGEDVQLALLDWRNTPADSGASPAQKMMARRTNTTTNTRSIPKTTTTPLPELEIGQQVRIQPKNRGLEWGRGICMEKVGPRSFLVQTEAGRMLRRNRRFLRSTAEPLIPDTQIAETESPTTHGSQEDATLFQPVGQETRQQPSYAEVTAKPVESRAKEVPANSSQTQSTSADRVTNQSNWPTKSTRTRTGIQMPAKYNQFVSK